MMIALMILFIYFGLEYYTEFLPQNYYGDFIKLETFNWKFITFSSINNNNNEWYHNMTYIPKPAIYMYCFCNFENLEWHV